MPGTVIDGCRSRCAAGTAVRLDGYRYGRRCRHAGRAGGWSRTKQKARHEDGLPVALAADAQSEVNLTARNPGARPGVFFRINQILIGF